LEARPTRVGRDDAQVCAVADNHPRRARSFASCSASSRQRHTRRFAHGAHGYAPIGQTVVQTGPVAAGNPFRFSTKCFDRETGLSYYGFRYYSPMLGRWISRDPIKEHGGYNLYVMTGNAPLVHIDRLGLVTYDYRPTNIRNMPWYSIPDIGLGDADDGLAVGDTDQHVHLSGRCVQQLNSAGNCECRMSFTISEYDHIRIGESYAGDADLARLIYGHEQRHIQSMRRELDRLGDRLAIEEAHTQPCSQCQERMRTLSISSGFEISQITSLESLHVNLLSPGEHELVPPIDDLFPPSSGSYVPTTFWP